MPKRFVHAFILSLCAAVLLISTAFAQWPTTCVGLNDIVEAHLGNTENVGIYQKVFGDQAEQACQNDHRDDVRSVFAWALPELPSVAQPPPISTPSPTPQPASEATTTTPIPSDPSTYFTHWSESREIDPVTNSPIHTATHWSTIGVIGEDSSSISVRCRDGEMAIFVFFDGEYLSTFSDNRLEVEWRWNDDSSPSSGRWTRSTNAEATFVPSSLRGSFGRSLIHASRLALRVRDANGDVLTSVYRFQGATPSDHPVRRAFQTCGQNI